MQALQNVMRVFLKNSVEYSELYRKTSNGNGDHIWWEFGEHEGWYNLSEVWSAGVKYSLCSTFLKELFERVICDQCYKVYDLIKGSFYAITWKEQRRCKIVRDSARSQRSAVCFIYYSRNGNETMWRICHAMSAMHSKPRNPMACRRAVEVGQARPRPVLLTQHTYSTALAAQCQFLKANNILSLARIFGLVDFVCGSSSSPNPIVNIANAIHPQSHATQRRAELTNCFSKRVPGRHVCIDPHSVFHLQGKLVRLPRPIIKCFLSLQFQSLSWSLKTSFLSGAMGKRSEFRQHACAMSMVKKVQTYMKTK